MPATVLDTCEVSVDQSDKDLCPHGAYIPAGKTDSKQ